MTRAPAAGEPGRATPPRTIAIGAWLVTAGSLTAAGGGSAGKGSGLATEAVVAGGSCTTGAIVGGRDSSTTAGRRCLRGAARGCRAGATSARGDATSAG